MNIIDLTHTYETGQTVGKPANHPTVALKQMARYETAGFNTSSILLGSHIGTHMDAQKHFYEDGETIDHVNLSLCLGEITIIDLSKFQTGQEVDAKDLFDFNLTERILLSFKWDRFYGTPQYTQNWPHISYEAAEYLLGKGVHFIATDVPSLDRQAQGLDDDFKIHRLMMKHNIIFVESLANTHLINPEKKYYFIALPLKLKDLDGSPCRALLVEK